MRRLVGLLGAVLWAAAPLPEVYAQTATPPRLVGFVPAEVPPEAAQIEAVVGLVITVAADGSVTDVKVSVMPWTAPPPAEVPAGGVVVRFLFAVRDLRGGIDWTGRAVCVR